MRLAACILLLSCTPWIQARADGPSALQLQQQFLSAPSTTPDAANLVMRQGGDVSATMARIPVPFAGIVPVAHAMTDHFTRRYDPRDFGATGDAVLLPLTTAAVAGATTLQVGADPRVLDPSQPGTTGQFVGQIGIPGGARVASIATGSGTTTLSLTSPLGSALPVGTLICLATHDDQPAFQAAETSAFHANNGSGLGVVDVGQGVYYLSTDVTNQGDVDIRLDGARVFGGFIGGGGNAIGVQQNGASEVRLLSTSSLLPSMLYYGEIDMSQPAPTGPGTQKAVFNAIMRSSDALDAAIGYYAKPSFSGTVQGGQEWAFQTQLQIPAGTDGYALILEGGIENNGTYQPEYGGLNASGASNAKLGLHIGCSGPVDCTAAEAIAGFGGHWHYGVWFKPGAIRSDGYALALASASGGLLSSIDAAGDIAGQGGSFAGPLAAAGSLTAVTLGAAGVVLGSNGAGNGEADIVGARGLGLYAVAPSASATAPSAGPALAIGQDGTVRVAQVPVRTQTGSYTLIATGGDCGVTIRLAGSIAATVTVPSGLPVGCRVDLFQAGSGAVTLAAATGVTMEAFGGATKLAGQYAAAQILIDTATTFRLSGQVQ